MKLARVVAVLGLGALAACSSSSPLTDGGDARHDAATGSADHPTGTAGAGAAGATGAAGTGLGGGHGRHDRRRGHDGRRGVAGAAGTTARCGDARRRGRERRRAGAVDARSDAAQKVLEFGPSGNRAVDVLFMVDNSSSMTPLQQKLIASFPAFINELKGLPGGLPNLHIAVVSSSMGAGRNPSVDHCPPGGDQGIFQAKPVGSSCTQASLNAGESFIITSGAGGPNFTGDVSDVFGCIAALGSGGCGFEHQFESVLRALGADGAAAPPQNAGFLRPDAILQIVLLTNEDDCSAPPNSDLFDSSSASISDPLGPLQSYRCNEFGHLCGGAPPPRTPASPTDLSGTCVSAEDGRLLRVADVVSALKNLKSDPRLVVVSAIAGPANPYIVMTGPSQVKDDPNMWPFIGHSCTSTDGTYGDPSVRIQQWVDAFGSNGSFQSICDASLGAGMPLATQLVSVMSGSPCLDAAVVPSACVFVDQVRDADGGIRDVPLASCTATAGVAPCWTLPAITSCPSGRAVQFVRASGSVVASTTATCPVGP